MRCARPGASRGTRSTGGWPTTRGRAPTATRPSWRGCSSRSGGDLSPTRGRRVAPGPGPCLVNFPLRRFRRERLAFPRARLYDDINCQFCSENSQIGARVTKGVSRLAGGGGPAAGPRAGRHRAPRPGPFRKAGVEMARRVLNRRQLRAESDEAARAEAAPAAAPATAGAPAPAKAARKPRKARPPKEPPRLRAVWGVFDGGMKQVAVFGYNQRAEADARVAQLSAGKGGPYFVQIVKVPMETPAAEAAGL